MGKTGEEDADARPVKKERKSKKSKNMQDVGDGNSNTEVDVGLQKDNMHREKKRKSDDHEDQHCYEGKFEDDGDLQKKDKKKRKRDSSEKAQQKENEPHLEDEPSVERDCDPKPRKEKKKKHKHQGQERELENEGVLSSIGISVGENVVDGNSSLGKSKKKKKKDGPSSDAEMFGIMTDDPGKEVSGSGNGEGSKSKKKTKSVEKDSEKPKVKGKKKTKSVENNMEKPKAKKGKSKKVSFSSHVEVFPSSDADGEKQNPKGDGLLRGKRFTPEEDEIVKEAVLNYIAAHDLGDEGLKMVLNCNSHPGMKKCWQEIGTCIPYRPYTAIYYRAHILFERAERRSWTPEEIEFLKEFYEKNGNNWKMAAEELGKHRFHVKDTWRRIKLKDLKSGRWTQEEYQSLYELVNLDLQMKITCQEKKSKHGMLRDNIPWTAISEKLSTRTDATCCSKWYEQLTSSLVAEKKWSDADDYRLIGALYELDAPCVEDVDWDNLLEHRPGDICRKRWDQMVLHIGHHGSKPFAEQVDTLAKRYRPDLAEIREAWDNKPVVP